MKFKFLYPLMYILGFVIIMCGCKKQLYVENSGSRDNPLNLSKPQAASQLFYSYESSWQLEEGNIATTNLATNINDFYFQFLNSPRPNFHVFNSASRELWGITFSNGKDFLIKYNVDTKTTTTADIFSATNFEREIININTSKKQITYLEGIKGQFGFSNVVTSKFDGSLKSTLVQTNNDIQAAVVGTNSIYYVSASNNALMQKNLINNTATILIKNFNLAGVKQFADFGQVVINNINYWSVKRVDKAINERGLSLLGVDEGTKQIFWVKDAINLIPKVQGEGEMDKYNKCRMSLFRANIDGSNPIPLDDKLNFALGVYQDKSPTASLAYYGKLQLDRVTKRLNFGFEVMTDRTFLVDYKGDLLDNQPNPSKARELKLVSVDYNGKNPKNLLLENGKSILYPENFSAIKWYGINWNDVNHMLFKGALDSFVLDTEENFNINYNKPG